MTQSSAYKLLRTFSNCLYVEAETGDAYHCLRPEEQIRRGLSYYQHDAELRTLSACLKRVLEALDEAELGALWRSTHPYYCYEGLDAHRRYFEMIRKVIATVLANGELPSLQREHRLREVRRPPTFGEACRALDEDLRLTGEGFGSALKGFAEGLDIEQRAAMCAFLDRVLIAPDAAQILREMAKADADVTIAIWDQPLLDSFRTLRVAVSEPTR